ncbi:MAG TPA: hypothetical protein VGD58_25585 [Herpetosiphonaceae bacterium]
MAGTNRLNDDELNSLLEVWKVLEVLTVSLDRMGEYWRIHGEEAAKQALHEFVGPDLFEKIADARTRMVVMLQAHDPQIREHMEQLAEDEAQLGYWDGPQQK